MVVRVDEAGQQGEPAEIERPLVAPRPQIGGELRDLTARHAHRDGRPSSNTPRRTKSDGIGQWYGRGGVSTRSGGR